MAYTISKKLFIIFTLCFLFESSLYAQKKHTVHQEQQKPMPPHEHNIIVVNGIGTVDVVPDKAFVTIGVQTQDISLKKAQEQNKKNFSTLQKSILNNGVLIQDFQTQNYYINPLYQYKDGKSTLKGYSVNNIIHVTVNNISNLSKIIDDASVNGANVVQSINFFVKNPQDYYKKALLSALANAKAKALTIAHSINVTIKQVVLVKEKPMMEGGRPPIPVLYRGVPNNTEGGDGFINKGISKICASVTVIYKY